MQFIDAFKTKLFEIHEKLPFEDEIILSKCFKILNPNTSESWSIQSINDGFGKFLPYLQIPFIPPTKDDLIYCGFGEKTNKNPFSINEIMCYIICRHFNYSVNNETTFDEMKHAVVNLIDNDKISGCRAFLKNNIKLISSNLVIKFAYECSKTEFDETENEVKTVVNYKKNGYNESSIINTVKMIDSNIFLTQRMTPETNSEAIAMTLSRFDICISESSNPIFQYKDIVRRKFSSETISKFIPHNDNDFSIKYCRNPSWFNVNENWFEELLKMYSVEKLSKFALHEGFINVQGQSSAKMIIFLKDRHKINNFYFGINPYCSKELTFLEMDSIHDFDESEIISFGNMSSKPSNFIYTTIKELTSYFAHRKMFIDPLSSGGIQTNVIEKLKFYVRCKIQEKTKFHSDFIALRNQLKELDDAKDMIDSIISELDEKNKNSSHENQTKLNNFFNAITEYAFYMRGWKVNNQNKFPLTVALSEYDKCEFQAEVYARLWEQYKVVKDLYRGLDTDIQNKIKILNLVEFSTKGNKRQIFNINVSGMVIRRDLSLMECIEKPVRENDSVAGCVRTNSNWLLFTSSWYSFILGFERSFTMEDIEEIV